MCWDRLSERQTQGRADTDVRSIPIIAGERGVAAA